jgi:hypothetical protein
MTGQTGMHSIGDTLYCTRLVIHCIAFGWVALHWMILSVVYSLCIRQSIALEMATAHGDSGCSVNVVVPESAHEPMR